MSMTDTTGAAQPGSWGARFKLRLSAIIWFILAAAFLLSLPVLLDISWLVVAGIAIVALILMFPAAWLTRLLFRGQRQQHWRTSLFKAWLALLSVISSLIALPIFALAIYGAIRSPLVPQAVLTNGTKTVTFQGMIHVGSEPFYKSVVYDIEGALADGQVIFYEGVQPGTPEAEKWFSDTLAGGADLDGNYQQFADVCGLQFQLPYFKILEGQFPNQQVKADVTTTDMMAEYERLMQSDAGFAAAMAAKPAGKAPSHTGPDNSVAAFMNFLHGMGDSQKSLLKTACRGLVSFMMSRPPAGRELNKVILDFRNRALVERIKAEPNNNIYMTYGAEHLPSLLADLQADDPKWEMKSQKWLQVFYPAQASGAPL
jgi:hypothetical protein